MGGDNVEFNLFRPTLDTGPARGTSLYWTAHQSSDVPWARLLLNLYATDLLLADHVRMRARVDRKL